MKTQTIIAAVFVTTISVAAVSMYGHADSKPATNTSPTVTTPTVVAPTDSSMKEKLTDFSFVEKAAQRSVEENKLSTMALQKSNNSKLKKFAQKSANTSTQTLEKLRTVASENRLNVSTELTETQKTMMTQMQQLKGSEFDHAYADLMKKTQDATVGLYDNAAGEGSLNVNLRVFANQQLPELRKNQKLAHALKATTQESATATPNKREVSKNN